MCAAVSPGGGFLLVAYHVDGVARLDVWHAQTLVQVRTMRSHDPIPLRRAVISADGMRIYAVGTEPFVRAWALDQEGGGLVGSDGQITHLAADPQGRDSLLVCDDAGVHRYIGDGPDPDWHGEGGESGMLAEFSPDGETIAGLSSREVVLWSRDGRRHWSQANDRRPAALVFDAAGRRLLACSHGEGARGLVLDVETSELLRDWWAPVGNIICAAFHARGLPVRVLPLDELLGAAPAAATVELALQGWPERSAESPASPLQGNTAAHVKQAVRADASAPAEPVRMSVVPGEDVVVMEMVDGPKLVLHPEGAQQLMAAPERTKGGLGSLLTSAVQVITGLSGDVDADLLASLAAQKIDGQVEAGVYRLLIEPLQALKGSGRRLATMPAAPSGGPQLVLLHGELVETAATFGSLWGDRPEVLRKLFDAYAHEVYAFDHATLGEGPIGNALRLAQSCAPGARLHLLGHSRGGLVAEVLALACAANDAGAAGQDALAKVPDEHAAWQALRELARARSLRVERIVRVGGPMAGSALLSQRLDVFLSLASWLLKAAGVGIAAQLMELAAQVARRRDAADVLPGLAALQPEGPFVAWLNAPRESIEGELRIVAGVVAGGGLLSRLSLMFTDRLFFGGDNDLVVQTESMFGGLARRPGASLFFVDRGSEVSHFQYFKNERTAAAIVDALLQPSPVTFAPVESRAGAS